MLEIVTIDALHVQDDYNYLIRDDKSGKVAVVDAADAEPILAALNARGWSLDYILMTHHHWDHVGGIPKLLKETNAQVVGYAGEERIPHCSIMVDETTPFLLGETALEVIAVPGHTLGHIVYYSAADKALFSGDTLFSMGCGRMFEGTAEQMHASLQRLAQLPDETRLFAGHEYTLSNLAFAKAVAEEQGDDGYCEALDAYGEQVQALRDVGRPSLPSILGDEKKLNPFLRAKDAEEFGRLRAWKDAF